MDWIIEDVEQLIDHRMLLVFDMMYNDDDVKNQHHKGHICSTGAPRYEHLPRCL